MVWWLVAILAGLGAVAVGLLPWNIGVCLSTVDGISLETKLLGKVKVFTFRKGFTKEARLSLLGFKFNLRGKGENAKADEIRADRGTPRLRAVLENLTIDGICVLARYFRDITGNTKTQLEITGELGLDDPAATGMACGLAWCLFGACGMKKVDLRPNFLVPVIAGEFKLVVSIVPLRMILHTVKTLLHPSVRKMWLALIAPRRAVIIREVQSLGS